MDNNCRKQPYIWNHLLKIVYSLCSFYGDTLTIKAIKDILYVSITIIDRLSVEDLSDSHTVVKGIFTGNGGINIKFQFLLHCSKRHNTCAKTTPFRVFCRNIGATGIAKNLK